MKHGAIGTRWAWIACNVCGAVLRPAQIAVEAKSGVSEVHLCAKCAAEYGYTTNSKPGKPFTRKQNVEQGRLVE